MRPFGLHFAFAVNPQFHQESPRASGGIEHINNMSIRSGHTVQTY